MTHLFENPYIISSYVDQEHFYGRTELEIIKKHLYSTNKIVWLKGNRRVGKTSILRKIQTDASLHGDFLPLFLDFAGTTTSEDWYVELEDSLDAEPARNVLKGLLTTLSQRQHERDFWQLQRQIHDYIGGFGNGDAGRKLLLLCDEVEAWIDTIKKEPQSIQRLRKEWERLPNVKVIITATKRLTELNNEDSKLNSPLLQLATPHYISRLTDKEADSVIEQSLDPNKKVTVDEETKRHIRLFTGCHPMLIQLLCSRLYQAEDISLRRIENNDLALDDYLNMVFETDYLGLAKYEQLCLRLIARSKDASRAELLVKLEISDTLLALTLGSLKNLGMIIETDRGLHISNYFLHQWLLDKVDAKNPLPSKPARPNLLSEKIKILIFASNPKATSRLELGEEIRKIHQRISLGELRNSLEIISALAVQPEDILDEINRHRPQIIHFSAHGNQSGEIMLTASDGTPHPVSIEAMQRLFASMSGEIRVAVINTCLSLNQANAISEYVDFTVGMNRPISDQGAIAFASGFYGALAFGLPVQKAFNQGRVNVGFFKNEEADIPMLITRPGIDPNKGIFE